MTDDSQSADLVWTKEDSTPAEWLVQTVNKFDYTVDSLIPRVFESYVRVFHPPAVRAEDNSEYQNVTWSQIAESNSRIAHPLMEWASLTGSFDHYVSINGQDGLVLDVMSPDTGSLPIAQRRIIANVLSGHTSTPEDNWYAVWYGWGDLKIRPTEGDVPLFDESQRPMWLFFGPPSGVELSFCEHSDQSANLWWPNDRAWCVEQR